MVPDIYLSVRFRMTSEGGRTAAVKGPIYHCPLIIDESAFDCRLLLGDRVLELGVAYEVPVKFLDKDSALQKLAIGRDVILWEGKDIADGKVVKICNQME